MVSLLANWACNGCAVNVSAGLSPKESKKVLSQKSIEDELDLNWPIDLEFTETGNCLAIFIEILRQTPYKLERPTSRGL